MKRNIVVSTLVLLMGFSLGASAAYANKDNDCKKKLMMIEDELKQAKTKGDTTQQDVLTKKWKEVDAWCKKPHKKMVGNNDRMQVTDEKLDKVETQLADKLAEVNMLQGQLKEAKDMKDADQALRVQQMIDSKEKEIRELKEKWKDIDIKSINLK